MAEGGEGGCDGGLLGGDMVDFAGKSKKGNWMKEEKGHL